MNIVQFLTFRYFLILYGSIVAFSFSPLLILLFVKALATISECPPNVQYSNAVCTNGDLLHGLSQAQWLLVFTLPVGFFLLGAVGALHLGVYLILKKRTALLLFAWGKFRRIFRAKR